MYTIIESKDAGKERKKLKSTSNATKIRVQNILQVISKNPYSEEFGGEDLKHGYTGYRSFELTKKDRIVIEVEENEQRVIIHQYLGHYEDK